MIVSHYQRSTWSGEWGNICSVYDNEVSKNGFILWSRLLMLGYLKRSNGGGPFHDKDFVFHESKGVHGATSFQISFH